MKVATGWPDSEKNLILLRCWPTGLLDSSEPAIDILPAAASNSPVNIHNEAGGRGQREQENT